jgi:hypothetical protein
MLSTIILTGVVPCLLTNLTVSLGLSTITVDIPIIIASTEDRNL